MPSLAETDSEDALNALINGVNAIGIKPTPGAADALAQNLQKLSLASWSPALGFSNSSKPATKWKPISIADENQQKPSLEILATSSEAATASRPATN